MNQHVKNVKKMMAKIVSINQNGIGRYVNNLKKQNNPFNFLLPDAQ